MNESQSGSVFRYMKLTATVTLLSASCLMAATALANDDLTQPIQVSADGHFLAQPDGKPFFWLGDTAWELFYRLDREETDRYLQDRAHKGFNVIQAVATGELDAEGLKRPNRAGETPFIDEDLSRPNPSYFKHIDWVVDQAARHGLRIALLPAWGSLFVSGSSPVVFDAAKAEGYGRWIAQRYRGKGILWVLGGDSNPLSYNYPKFSRGTDGRWHGVGTEAVIDYRTVYDSMAKGILDGDGGQPFITYHPGALSPSGAAIPRMSLYFGNRTWFKMSMLQSSHQDIGSGAEDGGSYTGIGPMSGYFLWSARFNYLPVAAEYRAIPSRPVIDGEPRYEDAPRYTSINVFTDPNYTTKRYWRSADARNAAYHALFAGAAGHTYGHFTIWNFYDPEQPGRKTADDSYDKFFAKYRRVPWQEALNAPGAGQMQHAKALMLSRPYFSRISDQSLIVGDAEEGERHVGATRDRNGSYALIYLPQGKDVTVDLSKLSGPRVVAWWFDPRSGTASKLGGELSTAQKHSFVPPTHGPYQDWVLVLDSTARHFAAPGVQL